MGQNVEPPPSRDVCAVCDETIQGRRHCYGEITLCQKCSDPIKTSTDFYNVLSAKAKAKGEAQDEPATAFGRKINLA